MSDQDLRDLLHDRVDDLTTTDLVSEAWRGAVRRRRAVSVAGVTAAAVVAVVVAVSTLGGGSPVDRSTPPASDGPSVTPSTAPPSPSPGGSRIPDGRYRGWSVFWGPTLSQEAAMPRVPSPLPGSIDLSAPAPDLGAEPLQTAIATFAVTENGVTRLLLLARDGTLRTVDVGGVAPLLDDAGTDVAIARPTLLSRSGRYAAFPQSGSLRILDIAKNRWRTIDTGAAETAYARWLGDDVWLPQSAQGDQGGPSFSAGSADTGFMSGTAASEPFGDSASPYGRWNLGAGGRAQVWTGVEGLPLPDGQVGPSQVLLIDGLGAVDRTFLVLGASAGAVRADGCCEERFWLNPQTVVYESDAAPRALVAWQVGSHRFGVVATIEGYDPARETVVSGFSAGIGS